MTDSLQTATDKLKELHEAAKKGTIIPIRLPGQIEEIVALMASARTEQEEAAKKAADSAVPADMADYMAKEAYFVGHAVHELRNPLTSVKGYIDMLGAMGTLNEMQTQFLQVVKTNVKRLESLLIDVGMINKLSKKTIKLNAKMDMFKNLALRVEKDMTPVAKELNRTLTFDIPSGLPILSVDGDMLVMLLNKLIENGLRYSPAETGNVKVSAESEDDGKMLVIHVEDNGIGMTEDDLKKLGEIYYRSDNDKVREYKGSGLGIPIVYGLVKELGGTISVTSTPDKGTKFTIRIPGMS
jgi:signal transduction histidine kinase